MLNLQNIKNPIPDTPGLISPLLSKKGHLTDLFPFFSEHKGCHHPFPPPAFQEGALGASSSCQTKLGTQIASKRSKSCSRAAQGAIATQQFLFLKTWKIVRTLSLRGGERKKKKKETTFLTERKKMHMFLIGTSDETTYGQPSVCRCASQKISISPSASSWRKKDISHFPSTALLKQVFKFPQALSSPQQPKCILWSEQDQQGHSWCKTVAQTRFVVSKLHHRGGFWLTFHEEWRESEGTH